MSNQSLPGEPFNCQKQMLSHFLLTQLMQSDYAADLGERIVRLKPTIGLALLHYFEEDALAM